jgi:hypothetical protein
MKIVGCDLHTRYQQIAMLDKETRELVERRLESEPRFPLDLPSYNTNRSVLAIPRSLTTFLEPA